MSFESIAPIASNIPSISADMGKSVFSGQAVEGDFQGALSNALGSASSTLDNAAKLGDKVITGEVGNYHAVSVAGMKADLVLKLTTQVAAKLSSAATTLFQMQM